MERETRVYKATHLLQAKVGRGNLDEKVVARCQQVMDENDFDFEPMARDYLRRFYELVDKSRRERGDGLGIIDEMTTIAMQLKANAAVFHYPIISKLAIIMLWLLESIEGLDDDAIDIAQAHYDSVETVLTLGLRNEDSEQSRELEEELKAACERYFNKMEITPQDVFYVEF
jgi:hypothetical protein